MICTLLLVLTGCTDSGKAHETGQPAVATSDSSATGDSATDSGATDSGATDSGATDSGGLEHFEPLVAGLAVTPSQSCAAPLDEPTWTEAGWAALGLTGPRHPNEQSVSDGGAIAVEDFNGDGYLDFALGYREERLKVLLYSPDTGYYITRVLKGGPIRPYNIQLADVDADGWPDLLVSGGTAPVLYRNSAGTFTPSPLPEWEGDENTEELIPGDIDGDGDTDLYVLMALGGVGNEQLRQDLLLFNDGTGSFTADFDAIPGVSGQGVGFDGMALDSDDDGDIDFYLGNDKGNQWGPNQLLVNQGGTLVPSEDCRCDIEMAAMGVDAADWSGDGLPDLVISDHATWKVLESLGDNTFLDVSLATGMATPTGSPEIGWGAIWLDWDNDGDLDIFGAMGTNIFSEGDLDNHGDGVILMDYDGTRFSDIAADKGLELEDNMRAVVALELNRDGVLDLIATPVNHDPLIYLSDGCTASGWLQVYAPPGSRVEVSAGDFHRVDWVSAQSSLGSSAQPMVHFGLGSEQIIDSIRVTWPGGEEVRWDEPLSANRRLRAWPPSDPIEGEGPVPPWR